MLQYGHVDLGRSSSVLKLLPSTPAAINEQKKDGVLKGNVKKEMSLQCNKELY